MKKHQATKAETPQIRLHIVRQRFLGERMIGERAYSRLPEVLATVTALLAMLVYSAHRGWLWV